MEISERQNQLLKALVENYISTAEPVASSQLSDSFGMSISPATIRNEMMELERLGYLVQPHISAGRVPTLQGFHYYIENLMDDDRIKNVIHKRLIKARRDGMRELTRQVADEADAVTFVAQSRGDYYIAGFSKLFSQPELITDSELSRKIAEVIDQIDVLVPELFGRFGEEPQVLLGDENPFGSYCSAIIASRHKGQETIVGIISPLRAHYARNISVLEEVMRLL